ncbi:MAG: DNA polymerase IV [Gammaproteobacteria bacterium]
MDAVRKIIHIDMDAFFAAVEQRDFPRYRGKPLVVGGMPDSRGVVSTCSYEARKYGIHSAMPSSHAYRLCPHAVFVKPRFEAYREAALGIRAIFSEYTELYEPLSLDEAYLDVSHSDRCRGSATLIAKDIKNKIRRQTALTASAGISYNKFLAKIASDIDKPDGLFVITPDMAEGFVAQLPIGKFHGIGKATEAKMHALGIRNGAELRAYSLALLLRHFGKAGHYYYYIARGIDNRPVSAQRESKSIGTEITFQQDIGDRHVILLNLQNLFEKALSRVQNKHLCARTLTVKIKYHDFEQITRSRTVNNAIDNVGAAMKIIHVLLQSAEIGSRKVRLLGVTLSSLQAPDRVSKYRQLDLFADYDR